MSAAKLHAQGVDLHNRGDYAGAVRSYSRALKLEPNNARILNDRGLAKKNLGDVDGALRDYSRAIKADPGFWPPYANRGSLLSRLEDFRGAVDVLTQGVAIAPKEPTLYTFRGNARACQMDYAGAVEDYSRAIGLNPRKAEAYYCRAVAYTTMAVLTDADGEVLIEGASYRPDPKASRQLLTWALADFKKADRLFPDDAWEREELGDAIREVKELLRAAS